MRKLLRLFFPCGAFSVCFLGLLFFEPTRGVLDRSSFYFFIITLAVGVFFSLRYGRSRHFFTILMLVLTAAAAPFIIFEAGEAVSARQRFYYSAAAMLVPLHLMLFAWWRERGLLNAWGAARMIWILTVSVGVGSAGRFGAVLNHPYTTRYFLENHVIFSRDVPMIPAAVTALCLVMLLAMYFRDSSPARDGFLWALVIMAAGFLAQEGPTFFQLTVSAAIIILLLSMIEAGHFFAYRDELTGLPARRAFTETLPKLGRAYTMAMIDVDHFKRFNDKYGHDVGDEVLKMVAAKLKKVRGWAFRYGGEEFTLIFPRKDMKQAFFEAERIRKMVETANFTIRKPPPKKGAAKPSPEKIKSGKRQKVSVTVSIGLARRSPHHGSPEAVLKAADN